MIAVDQIDLLSVGIDVGSSTSHLVFSQLTLKKDIHSPSQRFVVTDRKLVYEGEIIDTPLIDRYTIDIDAIVEFFKEEYKKAGIEDPSKVDTGAVIVTGETAKKQNAAEIVRRLSDETGKFVSAAAGPNFESLLAAMGSGAAIRSRDFQKTVLSVDIGGGTSNLAISSNGHVHSTSCINVGGRLMGIDEHNKIWRIDEPSNLIMKELDINYSLGDVISEEHVRAIAREYAKALVEVMTGPAKSNIAKELMMTDDLDFSIPIDEITFSGGVSEMIYGNPNGYNDIGKYLAEEINLLTENLDIPVHEPENKIRATVIGAGAYSLSISGSTCYFDDSIEFPIRNVPVVHAKVERTKLSMEHVLTEVKRAYSRFDLKEGEDMVALYFKDPVRVSYELLTLFAKSIENAMPNSVKNKKMIVLLFEKDIGNSVGNVIRRETAIKDNLICLDELTLEEGDWIDIGAPLISGQVFPVTVKSLVFNKNKQF